MAAEAIANHFKIDEIFNINEFDQSKITNYDTLFLGSNVRAFKVGNNVQALLKKIKKEEIPMKIFLFLVAGTPDPTGLEVAQKLKRKYETIQTFDCFGGRMTFAEMTSDDKKMIELAYKVMKRELEDYNDFKEANVLKFCQEVQELLK